MPAQGPQDRAGGIKPPPFALNTPFLSLPVLVSSKISRPALNEAAETPSMLWPLPLCRSQGKCKLHINISAQDLAPIEIHV